MSNKALIIGGSGGIAQALLAALLNDPVYAEVTVVSRGEQPQSIKPHTHLTWLQINSLDPTAVEQQVHRWQESKTRFALVVSTIGILHSENLSPEKKLEDINIDSLRDYFDINVTANAQWLKHGPKILAKQQATFVALSARVGSIADNRLGGWYGYRASKAALNMLFKTASIEYQRRMKHVRLVCYHPGTVDTELSAPFQANVKPEKLFTPEFTVSQLLSILPQLSEQTNLHYIDWQGETIPW